MKVPCPLSEPAIAGHTAVIHADGKTQSYAELSAAADACGRRLQEQGIGKDALVSILADDKGALLTLLPALWRLEAVARLLNPGLPEQALTQLQADSDLCRHAKDYVADPPASQTVLETDVPRTDLAAYITQLPTSGTTGTAKLVVHRFGNHLFNALGANRVLPVGPGDRWLLSLPLYHVGGLGILFRCFLTGATIALAAADETPGQAIDRLGISHLSLVPSQLRRLLQEPCKRWPRFILVGGAPLPASLRDEALDRGLNLYTSYGLTEMASQVTTGNQAADSGALLPGRELQISEEQEILVRGACLSPGYWIRGSVVDRRDADGWFHTGDLGVLHLNRLTVTGRIDNMLISGGENIHPEEIEAALLGCPGIVQAIVVARSDPEYGQRPVAFLDGIWSAPELRRQLLAILPSFKVPDSFQPLAAAAATGLKPDRQYLTRLANSQI